MNKVLVVVDMQNDFIDGALENKNAQKIVAKTAKFRIRSFYNNNKTDDIETF